MQNYYDLKTVNSIYNNATKNAFDFIDEATKDINDYTALTYFGNEMSYNDLKININLYANKLKSYGLKKGDTISLLLPNVPEIVFYYYGAWKLGVRVNPIDPRFNPEGIMDSINTTDSKLLIGIIDCYKNKIKPIIDKIDVDKIVLVNPTNLMKSSIKGTIAKTKYQYDEIILNMLDKDFSSSKIELNKDFLKGTKNDELKSVYEDDMIASTLFTSGTTGTPKVALLSHEGYNIKANQIKYGVPDLEKGDTFLGIIPFFSSYGAFAGMHNCLHKGMNLILIPKFDPDKVSELVCKYKASSLIGVPKYWEDFEKKYGENKLKYHLEDLSFLKTAVSGGDKINPVVVDKCNDLFKQNNSKARLIVGYGGTEFGGPVSTTIYEEGYIDNENTGILFPGIKSLFINPETKKIINSNSGELALCDPGMMIGYEKEEDTKNITIEYQGDKYFATGDLFTMNDKGMLYFNGRTKRVMMRPDGHTVHSVPIENTLSSSNIVEDCCVVGIKNDINSSGVIPTAFVTLKKSYKNNDETTKILDNIALSKLSERNRALAYVYLDKLPYTSMGKIDYKKLESLNINDLDLHIVDYTFFDKNQKVKANRKV